jgi:hypothetical protein
MFNIRRANKVSGQSAGGQYGAQGDPIGDLNPYLDSQPIGGDPIVDDLAEALAAELDGGYYAAQLSDAAAVADPMQPVDVETGRIHAGNAPHGYDQWDDEAIDQLAQELSRYEQFEPPRYDHGVLPPHGEAELAAAPSRRPPLSRKSMAVAVVALIAAGAVGYAMTGSGGIGGYGEPLLVKAPTAPFKVVPKEGDTIDEPIEPSVVFDQTAGAPPKGEERLLVREQEVPDLPGITPQVSRVILPDGQEIELTEPPAPSESGPRRVRTVLVRPDSSIIEAPDEPTRSMPSPTDMGLTDESSPIADAIAMADGQSAAGLPPLAASEQEEAPFDGAMATPSTDWTTPSVSSSSSSSSSSSPELSSSTGLLPTIAEVPTDLATSAGAAPVANAPLPRTRPAAPPAQAALDTPEPTDTLAPEPVPATTPEPAPVVDAPPPPTGVPDEPVQVAAVDPAPVQPAPAPAPAAATRSVAGPLDLADVAAQQPAPEPAPASEPTQEVAAVAPSAPVAGAYVQVSSQRSQDAAIASFRTLQSQHPSLMGGLEPDVQRADLGARGVYFRARIPQPSAAAANSLCASLKSAGVDCLVARR